MDGLLQSFPATSQHRSQGLRVLQERSTSTLAEQHAASWSMACRADGLGSSQSAPHCVAIPALRVPASLCNSSGSGGALIRCSHCLQMPGSDARELQLVVGAWVAHHQLRARRGCHHHLCDMGTSMTYHIRVMIAAQGLLGPLYSTCPTR